MDTYSTSRGIHCFVPSCTNNDQTTPDKVFVRIREQLKHEWCVQVNTKYRKTTVMYCCEDHLNLQEDLENYYIWKLMGKNPILKLTAKLQVNSSNDENALLTTKEQDNIGSFKIPDTSLLTSNSGDAQRKENEVSSASHSSISALQKLLMQTEEPSPPGISVKKAQKSRHSASILNVKHHVASQCSVKMIDKSTNYRCRKTLGPLKATKPKLSEPEDPMCRVCQKLTGSLSLCDKDGGVRYRDKIMRWTSLVILKGDGLPNFICTECAEVLNTAHEFFEQCENSDRELRSEPLSEAEVAVEFIKLEEDPINLTLEDEVMTYEYIDYIQEKKDLEEHCKEEINQYDSSDATDQSSHRNERDQQNDGSYEPDESEIDTCSEPDEEVRKKNRLYRKNERKRIKPFPCTQCKESFVFEKSLSRHVEQWHRQRRFVCETCGASTVTKASLLQHQFIHTNLKPYKCQLCDKAFNHRANLRKHTEHHSAERKYSCDLCPKAFKTKGALYDHVNHTMTHANEKIQRFSCNFCDMTFSAKCSLRTHIKNKHVESLLDG